MGKVENFAAAYLSNRCLSWHDSFFSELVMIWAQFGTFSRQFWPHYVNMKGKEPKGWRSAAKWVTVWPRRRDLRWRSIFVAQCAYAHLTLYTTCQPPAAGFARPQSPTPPSIHVLFVHVKLLPSIIHSDVLANLARTSSWAQRCPDHTSLTSQKHILGPYSGLHMCNLTKKEVMTFSIQRSKGQIHCDITVFSLCCSTLWLEGQKGRQKRLWILQVWSDTESGAHLKTWWVLFVAGLNLRVSCYHLWIVSLFANMFISEAVQLTSLL